MIEKIVWLGNNQEEVDKFLTIDEESFGYRIYVPNAPGCGMFATNFYKIKTPDGKKEINIGDIIVKDNNEFYIIRI
jgi:hypothetical protein